MRPSKSPATPCGWLVEALLAANVELDAVSGFLGRPLTARGLDRLILPSETFLRLFEWGARICGDPDLGVHIAAGLTARDVGLLGYLLENSQTLGEWVRNVTHYHEVFSQDAEIAVSSSEGIIRLDYVPVVAVEFIPLQDICCSLGMIVQAIRLATKRDWHPVRCRLVTPPPADGAALRALLGPELHFNQEVNRIEMPESDLSLPIPNADPVLFAILKEQADGILATLSQQGELVNRLRLLITAHLSEGNFDTVRAARELNMSVRKLHRELRNRGTSFRKLRDEIVTEAARAHLADPHLQITEIAHRLGYSETSAFTRAFRRLEGRTPRAFRDNVRDEA